MSLPTVQNLKDHLRIMGSAENTVLTDILADAKADVEDYIGRPITAVEKSYEDEVEMDVLYGSVTRLLLPEAPVSSDTEDAPVITDGDGATVSTDDYTWDYESGIVRAVEGVTFSNPPYTIVATVGLSADPDYASRIERLVRRVILELAGSMYVNRTPATVAETAGGGTSRTFVQASYAPAILGKLERLRMRLP